MTQLPHNGQASPAWGMFVTDFDGTLLTDRKTISPLDLQTLVNLREDGILTVVATGRSLFSFHRALDEMGLLLADLPLDYLVFSTGAGIYCPARDKIILSHALSGPELKTITAYFDDREFDYMVHQAIPDTPHFLFKSHGRPNPDFHHRIALNPSLGRPLKGDADLFESGTEVLAILPGGSDGENMQRIKQELDDFSVILATSPLDHKSAWIEVFHRAVSKSRSVEWLAGCLGIARDKVVAVGNDYNDLDLLEWSGQGILVENGPQDLKSRFRVVGSNNACGVSQAARSVDLLTA